MPATALLTKLPHAEPPSDCQSKQVCSRMATHGVLVKEGERVLYKRLCETHAHEVDATAKAGRLSLAARAIDRLNMVAAPPPPPPPPFVPFERPRIVFAIPAEPLLAKCSSCPASIVWINHPRTKSLMPVNADGERRGESHFATCPNANMHRKKPR